MKDATQSGTAILNKSFQYDVVGNITGISNTAGAYSSLSGQRLGGEYALENITYDGMNQLSSLNLKYGKSPAGLGASSLDQDLQLSMIYAQAGKISTKNMGAFSATTSLNHELNYSYANASSDRLSSIDHNYPAAQQNNGTESFSYNLVGSISERSFTKSGALQASHASKYQWTEDQKLRGVLQEENDPDGNLLNSSAHHYMHDHKGERMIKTNFYLAALNVNSRSTAIFPMEVPTVYVNPYFIANHYSETVLASKHYYMGGQRFATALISYDFDPPVIPGPTEPGGEPEVPAGYSYANDGGIVDIVATLRLLFNLPSLELNMETFQLQSIGEPITFEPCTYPAESGENPIPEGENLDHITLSDDCACEQSVYWANLEGYNCEELNILYFYHPDYLEFLLIQYPDSTGSLTKLTYFHENQWIYTEGNLVSEGNHSFKFINYYDLKSVNVSIDSVADVNEALHFYFPPVNYHDLFMRYPVIFKNGESKSFEKEGPIVRINRKVIENWDTLKIELDYIDYADNLVVKVPQSRFFSYYYRFYLPVDMDHYFVPYDLSFRIQNKKIVLSNAIVDGGRKCFKKVKKISPKELGVLFKAL